MNVSFKGLANSSCYTSLISNSAWGEILDAKYFYVNRLSTQVNNKGTNDLDFFEPVLKDFPDIENNKNFLIFDMVDVVDLTSEKLDKIKTNPTREDLPILSTKFYLNGKELRTDYNECFKVPEKADTLSKLYKKDLGVLDKIAVLAKKMSTMKFFPKTTDYYNSDEIFQNTYGALKMFFPPKEYELRLEKFKQCDEFIDYIKCFHHPSLVAEQAKRMVTGMTTAVMKSLT